MNDGVLTVSQVTAHVKRLLDRDELLQELLVRGEVANFTRHSSGHLYFSLRDADSQLGCVFFRGPAQGLTFKPEDGMAVVAGGSVTVYERGGRYQLVVRFMRPDGLGDLQARFEALKAQLEAEGLFDPSRKRPVPRFPRCIALCTSPTGAAIRDLTTILARRYPLARMIVFPTVVQGEAAAPSIVASLRNADTYPEADVIIVGRGGGSLEDLWAFNEESVARAVFACHKPVVSAVGHESDVSICDLVADLRAATPSAAAELVVPDQAELLAGLEMQGHRLRGALLRVAQAAREGLQRLAARTPLRQPERLLEPWQQRLDEGGTGLMTGVNQLLESLRDGVARAADRLAALGPLAVLERGYAIVRREADGVVVRSPAQVPVGEAVGISIAEGDVLAQVTRHRQSERMR